MKKNKKIDAIIPIKSVSKRIRGKNFKLINGKPLYSILLNKLKKCNFDEVYVDTDSLEIKKFCNKNQINTLWGIGGSYKKNSSSWILKKWEE